MEIIKGKDRWDETGESVRSISIVRAADENEIQSHMRYRCHCEHDCCGHVSQGVSSIRKLPSGDYAVRTYGWRNV
jgi:hypothetical protein